MANISAFITLHVRSCLHGWSVWSRTYALNDTWVSSGYSKVPSGPPGLGVRQ